METTAGGRNSEFLVFLREQADLSGASALATKLEKGQFVFQELTGAALRTQPSIVASLEADGIEYQSFWVANMVWVRGSAAVVEEMARRPEVARVSANPSVAVSFPQKATPADIIQEATGVEWNITLVNAPDVWNLGYDGQGVIIGGQDTGYDWDHPALIQQYQGWNGVTVTHDFNWHDAIHTGGSSCGPNSTEPCDDNGHGTHTMGTMVGDDGGNNKIGMAPGAQWIGCRNMKSGWGTPATYAECYQWFIAPTDLGGQDPDPARAPHVINNSWSCPPAEGCTDPDVLRAVVENVRAAGILTVHSAGNSGPLCNTVNHPAAIYDASFSVGATTINDGIASFSSRGPVSTTLGNLLKPDISAPGSYDEWGTIGIRSSVPGSQYGYKSGTSMAAPHVAGLAALLISADPFLAGDVDLVESLIQLSAVPLTTSQGCGGDGPVDVPNNVFGYGRIDALAALERSKTRLLLSKAAAPIVDPGKSLTYTLTVTNQHVFSAAHNIMLADTVPTGTSFITATAPHVFDGQQVAWSLSQLDAGHSWQVNLVVWVPTDFPDSFVENRDYGVSSDEIHAVISGAAVRTLLPLPYVHYFPFLSGP
jgi:uncharacterized repeat protein (TIGR01451 family)